MGEAIEQRGCHLRIAEHAWPFAEGEIGGDDDRGALIEPADQMEQQLPAGLGERQIAQFVEDDEVEADEIVGQTSLTAAAGLAFQPVDQVDDGVEPAPGPAADARPGDGDGEMALAGAGRSSVILPGVRRLRFGLLTRFIRAAARLSRSSVRGAMPALNT
jgi:hypothetical protein